MESKLEKMLRYHGVKKAAKAKDVGIAFQTFSASLDNPIKFRIGQLIKLCESTPELEMTPEDLAHMILQEYNDRKEQRDGRKGILR